MHFQAEESAPAAQSQPGFGEGSAKAGSEVSGLTSKYQALSIAEAASQKSTSKPEQPGLSKVPEATKTQRPKPEGEGK